MKKQRSSQIEVVIPDAGPLISLARADALGILLIFKDEVRLVITDFVEFEVTRNRDKFPDAKRICDFINKNAGIVEIRETTLGEAMKKTVQVRERYDEDEGFRNAMKAVGHEPPQVPKDIGELTIVSYANSLITEPPGIPVLVLAEDDFFLHSGAVTPGNAHVLSTRALLDTLQILGKIPDAAAIWEDIQKARPNINQDKVDRQASKIKTEWLGAIDDDKVKRFSEKRKNSQKQGTASLIE